MSDTPRTEAEVARTDSCPLTGIVTVDADFACQLERELNAAEERIRQQELLDDENLRLRERIKLLEEAGDEMAKWLSSPRNVGGDPLMAAEWRKAKEDKP